MRKYKLGMYLGRFQPFHNGHKAIVDQMLKECKEVVVVIGSPQTQDEIKNPYFAWERVNMIKLCYPNTQNLHIICLPDRDEEYASNDSSWGDYVFEYLRHFGFIPDVIYQGFETERKSWWTSCNGHQPDLVVVSRINIPISGTLVRSAILEKNWDFVGECLPDPVFFYLSTWRRV